MPTLQDSAVFDQRCHASADLLKDLLAGRACSISHSGRDSFDDGIDFTDMDKAVAVGARHLRVHLRHYAMRILRRGQRACPRLRRSCNSRADRAAKPE